MESIVNYSFRSKTVFQSLPAVDQRTLPISKMELFMTIGNDFQPLINLLKKSVLNVRLGSKYASFSWWLLFTILFQNVVQDCSFKEFFIFHITFFFTQSIFMKWLSVCIIVITSYNNAVL